MAFVRIGSAFSKRRISIWFLASTGAYFLSVPYVGATTLSDNLSEPTTYTELINASSWIGASFGTGNSSYALSTVTALIQSDQGGVPSFALYSDSAAGAPGKLLGILQPSGPAPSVLSPSVFDGNGLPLLANQTYWLVMSPLSGTSEWAYTTSNSGTGVGFKTDWSQSTDGGLSWLRATSEPMQMKVDAIGVSSVPEPSPVLLLLLGLGLVAIYSVRNRWGLIIFASTLVGVNANAQCHGNTHHPNQACTKIHAVINGPVNSLIYQELSKYLEINSGSGGGLSGSDYDVLIFDGKQLLHRADAEKLKGHIKAALNSDRWVLGINVSEQQKREYFLSVIHGATKNSNSSFLVRRISKPEGTSAWSMIVSHPIPDVEDPKDSAQLARFLYAYLSNPDPNTNPPSLGDEQANWPPQPDFPIPSSVPHLQLQVTIGGSATTLSVEPALRSNALEQSYSILMLETVTAFYDDQYANGPVQEVLVQSDATFDPTAGTNYWANRTTDEQAFLPIFVNMETVPENQGNFNLLAYGPETPNLVSTYDTNSSFSIGTSGFSYHYSCTTSFQLAEWGVQANGSGVDQKWQFQSTDPDATQLNFNDNPAGTQWWGTRGNPNPNAPNGLSTGESVYHTATVYQTTPGTILTDVEQFNTSLTATFVDFWCADDHWGVCDGSNKDFTLQQAAAIEAVDIDMSAVAATERK